MTAADAYRRWPRICRAVRRCFGGRTLRECADLVADAYRAPTTRPSLYRVLVRNAIRHRHDR